MKELDLKYFDSVERPIALSAWAPMLDPDDTAYGELFLSSLSGACHHLLFA